MRFQARLRQLSGLFAISSTLGCSLIGGDEERVAQTKDLDVLTAEEISRVLTGNTLIGTRDGKRYWIYHPSGAAMWGMESGGDVDIGSWHLDGDLYCRAWRRWHDGRKKCWQLAVNPLHQLVWLDPGGRAIGSSQLQAGNTIGLAATPQQVQAFLDPEISPALEPDIRELAQAPVQVRPHAGDDPVDAFGIPLVPLTPAPAGLGEVGAGEPGFLNASDLVGPSIVGGSKLVDSSTIRGGATSEANAGADAEGTAADFEADAAADLHTAAGSGSADVGAEADPDAGEAAAEIGADADADASADAGGASVEIGADAEADARANADGASAEIGADAEADASADAGGASVDIGADAAADLNPDVDGASGNVDVDAGSQ